MHPWFAEQIDQNATEQLLTDEETQRSQDRARRKSRRLTTVRRKT